MKKILFLTLLSWGWASSIFAGDCANATPVVDLNYTYTSLISYTTGCNLDATLANGYNNTDGCTQSIWFEWDPQNPGNCYDLRFFIRFSSFRNPVNIYLIYSESKDAWDPCSWSGVLPPAGAPSTLATFSVVSSARHPGSCCPADGCGSTFSTVGINAEGLDGSGTYYVVVQKATGGCSTFGGQAQLRVRHMNTGSPGPFPTPANDSCKNATVLSSANGIDPSSLVTGSPIPTWADSHCGSNRCATKQRPTDECVNSGETEDHWWGFLCAPQTLCGIGNADNNVWYKFNLPVTAPTSSWYLQMGNVSCTGSVDPHMQVVLMRGNPCTSGSNATTINCPPAGNADVRTTAALPTPDKTFGPFNLSAGTDYYIMVDGFQYAQCNFCMLLTRDNQNPILPMVLADFSGINRGYINDLEWATLSEQNTDYFVVERSNDGLSFEDLGEVTAAGFSDEPRQYQFADKAAPAGRAWYRLRLLDQDGTQSFSDMIELYRSELNFEVNELYPVPMRDELHIVFSALEADETELVLTDMAGRVVQRQFALTQAGANALSMSVADLASGVYFLRIRQAHGELVRKVVK